MDLELAGKTAIVTGGSRGIGKAVARELALEGVDVAILARDQARLEAAAREIAQGTARRVLPIAADMTVDEAVRGAVARVAETFGRVDILVNNATAPAEGAPPRLAKITYENFWPEMNVKVMGFLRCAREVAPHMKQQGWGRIINVGGLASRVTDQMLASIRNAGVSTMTKHMAAELGRFGITVTAVLPGITRTERMTEVLESRSRHLGITVQEVERRMVEEGPFRNYARRAIEPREVAYVVLFLASPKAVAINGDSIPAGGGVGQGIYY